MTIPTNTNSNSWYKKTVLMAASAQNIRYLLTIAAIAATGVLLWYGYNWHFLKKQADAQYALMGCLQQFDRMEKEKNPDWSVLQKVCTKTFDEHARSNAAPYLLALEADILIRQNKKEEALDKMNKAVGALSTSSPVYYLYKTKTALMKLDNESFKEEGLKELESLANDIHNKNRDEALYYLGLYYWTAQESKKAQEIWKPLMDMAYEGDGGSVFAARVQEKMKLI